MNSAEPKCWSSSIYSYTKYISIQFSGKWRHVVIFGIRSSGRFRLALIAADLLNHPLVSFVHQANTMIYDLREVCLSIVSLFSCLDILPKPERFGA
jgi:hypothetical protein